MFCCDCPLLLFPLVIAVTTVVTGDYRLSLLLLLPLVIYLGNHGDYRLLFVLLLQGEALPIDIRTLSDLAERCHAYAKALHYKVRTMNQLLHAVYNSTVSGKR